MGNVSIGSWCAVFFGIFEEWTDYCCWCQALESILQKCKRKRMKSLNIEQKSVQRFQNKQLNIFDTPVTQYFDTRKKKYAYRCVLELFFECLNNNQQMCCYKRTPKICSILTYFFVIHFAVFSHFPYMNNGKIQWGRASIKQVLASSATYNRAGRVASCITKFIISFQVLGVFINWSVPIVCLQVSKSLSWGALVCLRLRFVWIMPQASVVQW